MTEAASEPGTGQVTSPRVSDVTDRFRPGSAQVCAAHCSHCSMGGCVGAEEMLPTEDTLIHDCFSSKIRS